MDGKTISFVKGKGSLRHNNRDFFAANVDQARTDWNRTYVRMTLEEAYDHCFGEALREYNERQKRKDRRKDDYISEIRTSGNREKVFYENIVQIGTMKDTPVKDEQGRLTPEAMQAVEVLEEYAQTFQERNPNLFLFNAVLHLDEATPHLHLDYIPVAHGYKNGLKTRNSLTKALQQMGFEKGKGRRDNEIIDWQHREREYIEGLCNERGIEITVIGEDREDYSLPQYREIMQKISEKESEIGLLDSHKAEAAAELELLKKEQSEYTAQAQEARDQIEQDLADARQELAICQLTRDTMDSVRKEVRSEISQVKEQAVPARSLLGKTEYVKIPKNLWEKIMKSLERTLSQSKMTSRLTGQVQALRSRVSDLERKLSICQAFLKEQGLQETFSKYLQPQKRSILEQLKEEISMKTNTDLTKNRVFDIEKRREIEIEH